MPIFPTALSNRSASNGSFKNDFKLISPKPCSFSSFYSISLASLPMVLGITSKKIIMVDPAVFAVNYVINPWMEGNINTVNAEIGTLTIFHIR